MINALLNVQWFFSDTFISLTMTSTRCKALGTATVMCFNSRSL